MASYHSSQLEAKVDVQADEIRPPFLTIRVRPHNKFCCTISDDIVRSPKRSNYFSYALCNAIAFESSNNSSRPIVIKTSHHASSMWPASLHSETVARDRSYVIHMGATSSSLRPSLHRGAQSKDIMCWFKPDRAQQVDSARLWRDQVVYCSTLFTAF
jgi:hypothetical protein